MTARRTANGKMIDMNALIARHEKTRAVGNMNVNARGDTIDSHNRVINDSSKRVNNLYKKTMQQAKVGTQSPTQPLPNTSQVPEEKNSSSQSSQLMNEFENYDDGWDENIKK